MSFISRLPKIILIDGRASHRSKTISDLHITESNRLLKIVLDSLDDDKAQNVISIPLAGKSTLADYMVIASGGSSRQLTSMAEHLARRLSEAGNRPLGSEGGGDWILIDAGDVIVHLFRPEVREFYQLEKMWLDQSDAEIVPIHTSG